MARVNVSQSLAEQLRGRADATVNHEGGLAFELDPRSRLYTRACSSLVREDKFYTDADQADAELLADITAVAAATDPEFVLRMAAYSRQIMNIRSTPVACLVAAAAIPACKPFVRKWTPEIVRRADEVCEVIAWWILLHGQIGAGGKSGGEHAFPNCLTRGLEDAMNHFDEYQYAKYDRDNASVTFRHALRIIRQTPKSATQSALFKYLVRGDIDVELLPKLAAKAALLRKDTLDAEALELAKAAHVTHEVLTSKFGSNAATWNALDLPFMAGLRNIANLMRTGADEALTRVLEMFRTPGHVARSKQLPFRFFSAYRLIESGQRFDRKAGCMVDDSAIANHPRRAEVMEAVLTALESSVVNLPRLSGRTFITSDNSGSMQSPISQNSTVSHCDVANLLAAISQTMCDDAICSVFGESHRVVPVIRKDSILTNMDKLKRADVGHSTNAYLAIRHLRTTKTRVDRIVVFSDMQCYSTVSYASRGGCSGYSTESLVEELAKYRSSVNPEVFVHSVDLAGHGTSQFPSDDRRTALLSGWSEKLLQFIPLFEAGSGAAVDLINRWEPPVRRSSAQADLSDSSD